MDNKMETAFSRMVDERRAEGEKLNARIAALARKAGPGLTIQAPLCQGCKKPILEGQVGAINYCSYECYCD